MGLSIAGLIGSGTYVGTIDNGPENKTEKVRPMGRAKERETD